MELRTYLEGIVLALNTMAARMGDAAPPFAPDGWSADRADAVREWRRARVLQVREAAQQDIQGLEPPVDLSAFHDGLLRSIAADAPPNIDDEANAGDHTHDSWQRLMMQLAMLCTQAGVPFPTSHAELDVAAGGETAPDTDSGWQGKVRRALERRGDPDPDEAIAELERLQSGDDS